MNSAAKAKSANLAACKRSRVPASASQYRFHTSYSNRVGKNGASRSALRKTCYDWMFNAIDPETGEIVYHGRKRNDVAFTHVHVKSDMPLSVSDPIVVAQKAYEKSRGKRGDTRQMSHHTISLPKQLNDRQLNELVCNLAQLISELHDDVPVFAARHLPDGDNHNHHVHIDHPIHHIVADNDTSNDFHLGNRITHFERPQERARRGLPKTNHDEIRELRKRVAHLIADHLEIAQVEYQLCQRWRHGHLRLNAHGENQITHAVERGDVVFVMENAARAVSKHEGPGAQRVSGAAESHKAHNNDLPTIAPELLLETLIRRIIDDAKTAKLDNWQEIQLLAMLHGVSIKWNRTRKRKNGKIEYGRVSGIAYEIEGVRVSGKSVNLPLSILKEHFPELGHPKWQTRFSDAVKLSCKNKILNAGLSSYNADYAAVELGESTEKSVEQVQVAAYQNGLHERACKPKPRRRSVPTITLGTKH